MQQTSKITQESILYTWYFSAPCRALETLIKLGNLSIKLQPVNLLQREQQKPEFLKINPMGQVPTFQQNDFILTESNAIMKHICRNYRGKLDDHWFPFDNYKRKALIEQVLSMISQILINQINDYLRATVFKQLQQQEVDKISKKQSKYLINQGLQVLQKFIMKYDRASQNTGSFFFDGQPTIADLKVACYLQQLFCCKKFFKFLRKFPRILQCYDAFLKYPEFKQIQDGFLMNIVALRILTQEDLDEILKYQQTKGVAPEKLRLEFFKNSLKLLTNSTQQNPEEGQKAKSQVAQNIQTKAQSIGKSENKQEKPQQQNTQANQSTNQPQSQNATSAPVVQPQAQQQQKPPQQQQTKVESQAQNIQQPQVPQNPLYAQYKAQVEQKLTHIQQTLSTGNWSNHYNKNNIVCTKRPYNQDWLAFRIETVLIGKNLNDVIKYFTEEAYIMKWKEGIEKLTVVATLGPDLRIIHELNQKQSIMDQREFLVVEFTQQTQDTIIMTGFSAQYAGYENVPKGRVRGEVFAILAQTQQGINMTFSGSSHPKGNISGPSKAEKMLGKVIDTVIALRKQLGL